MLFPLRRLKFEIWYGFEDHDPSRYAYNFAESQVQLQLDISYWPKASPQLWPQLRASKLRPQDPGTQSSRMRGLSAKSAFVDAADVAAPVLLLAARLRPTYARIRLSALSVPAANWPNCYGYMSIVTDTRQFQQGILSHASIER
ncbi:hypothetical protein FANTH_12252 [Fusarium anthophilum]|uniref:Uncharacterized protein n=1 Tax=Fusarium anthophilum TaxID=48485 RepID=A0A8H4YUQ7_9HYPO|nr:hypothetical protein FANTH_12252 [Fusarium anthophilum]